MALLCSRSISASASRIAKLDLFRSRLVSPAHASLAPPEKQAFARFSRLVHSANPQSLGKTVRRILQQIGWRSFQTNPSRININDVIRINHCFEAMCDKQHGSVRELLFDRSSHAFL